MYATPLIPRRALMPLRQARSRELHYARGIKGPKFLVDGPDGKLFTVPDAAVWALCELDREGAFDDPPPGNAVRLTGCELLAAPELQIDSPFLFLIRDTRSGSILFMGHVEDPRQGS